MRSSLAFDKLAGAVRRCFWYHGTLFRRYGTFGKFHVLIRKSLLSDRGMTQREKLMFVYDADGSIGVVMEFSESDFEAYAMPDLALVGAFHTKAQAAQALGARIHQFRH